MTTEIKPTTIQLKGRFNRMFERLRLANQIPPTKQGLADWLVEEEFKRQFPDIDPDTLKAAANSSAAPGKPTKGGGA